MSMFLCHIVLYAQTPDQNYIAATTPLDASGIHEAKTVQYYDGLGRESVVADGSMNTQGRYVYGMTEYDMQGRPSRSWLPVAGTTSPDMKTPSQMASMAQSAYNDSHAYSDTQYDALGRPVFTSTPGDAWHNAGKGMTTEYTTNAVNSVKRYAMTDASGGSFNLQGYYEPATLTGEKTTDEDGRSIEIFRDLLGNTVLERRGGDNDTYFVYDKGLLCVVIPPLYQTVPNSSLLYKYKYDGRGRCIQKTLPGCDPINYWYDKGGRVAFMQDGRMAGAGKYRFFLYDGLGRLAIQGLCTGGSMDGARLAKVTFTAGTTGLAGTGYVVHDGYSVINAELEIANYYDGYACLQAPVVAPYVNASYMPSSSNVCTTTLQTAQLLSATDGEHVLHVMYYDEKGQNTSTVTSHLNKMIVQENSTYSFTGKPTQTLMELFRSGSAYLTRYFSQNYTYDTNSDMLTGRKISGMYIHDHNIYYTHDNLGRLTQADCNNLVTNSYAYDLHGWMKSLSSTTGSVNLLTQDLYYADGSGTPLWSGNISSMRFQDSSNTNSYSGYRYTYDNLGRLTQADYCAGEQLFMLAYTNSETAEYNANSAITRMKRNGPNPGGYGYFDDVSLNYTGNQLKNATEACASLPYSGTMEYRKASAADTEYYYDGCGSLTADINKGISHIGYDMNGMPTRIQFTKGDVTEYIYSADGQKLRTIHRTAVPGLTVPLHQTHTLTAAETLYVDSTTYAGSVEIDGSMNTKWYFGEGYLQMPGTSSQYTTYYTIPDYQGNIRKVVKSDGTVVQQTAYYPFGGLYVGSNANTGSDVQTHKYNGKELDRLHGLDLCDYGARQYDPTIGQFLTIDPLAEKYYHLTPYSYCGGNPVNAVDPDGRYIVWLDNHTEWRYNYDKGAFFDSDGNEYNGDNKFVTKLTGLLSTLRAKKAGRELVKDLANNVLGVVIAEGSASTERLYSDPNSLHPDIVSAVTLCSSQEVDGWQEDFTTLAHEMAHAQDRIHGTRDESVWFSIDGRYVRNTKDVRKTEIYATHIENLIRAENNIALRTHYISTSTKIIDQLVDVQDYTSLYFINEYNHKANYQLLKRNEKRYKYK